MRLFPESWRVEPASSVCSEIVDCLNKTAPTVEKDTGLKMIRTTNVKSGRINLDDVRFVEEKVFLKWTRRLLPRRNDIVLTREAPLGEVGLLRADDKAMLGQRTMVYRADGKNLDQIFLYYSLLGPVLQAQIRTLGSGSTVEHMRVPDAETLAVPLPQLAEQRKIAALLSAYDELIENNRQRIVLLERMGEQIYREWFVRFRFPGYQQAKFEKGVPRDWTKARFSDLCTLQRGFDLPDAQIVDGNYPVVASTSIKAFHHAFKVEPPVITTGRSGSLGDVLWTNERAWPLNTALYVKDFRGNSPYFVFHTLGTMHLENFNSGAGVPSLNRNHLSSLPIAIPPLELQDAFSKQVGPMQSLKENLENACAELSKTRDLLLPRLISGKLRVDELDIRFPPSMQTRHA
jgi:type I restriction enzyme S subunit